MTVSDDYRSLAPWLQTLPDSFGEGRLLHAGRNEIRAFSVEGHQLVVKRYKKHDWIKRLVYTFGRKSKARRAYENAVALRQRGFSTPHEVAFLEIKKGGLLTQVYYICEMTDAQPIRPRLIDTTPFDQELATEYARFVATLHEKGVLHRDLNPTNVLFKTTGERPSFEFELIDINRMQFYDGAVPERECMENLTLFWWLTDVYRFVLQVYAKTRGWNAEKVAEAVRVKERHDRRWKLRKRITHPFR